MESKNVGVLGGGAWGTGLAQALARGGHTVQMWALEPEVKESVNKEHENKRYLPGYKLSENLTVSNDIIEVATGKEFLIIASPSLFLASTIRKITAVPNIADGTTRLLFFNKEDGYVNYKDDNGACYLVSYATTGGGIPKIYFSNNGINNTSQLLRDIDMVALTDTELNEILK